MTERQIIIGLIVSTDYLRQIKGIWNYQFLESTTAKRIAHWCWEYFDKYDKAPGKNIESIFYEKAKDSRFPKEVAKEIEEDILPGLSEEFANEESFNLDYLLDQTAKYFMERKLILHTEEIEGLLGKGDIEGANNLACEFKPTANLGRKDLDLGSAAALERIDKAFSDNEEILIKYPNQLGDFWNDQLTRGAFVVLEGIEKRGKTYRLLEMAFRGCMNGKKVAFFEAGDMSEKQLIRRFCIHLAGKSDKKKYCQAHYQPCRDCIKNQLNECEKPERECNFGPFEGQDINKIKYKIQYKELLKAVKDNEDYSPCFNCKEYFLPTNHWGAVWLKYIPEVEPLTKEEAKQAFRDFFYKNSRKFKLSIHSNRTLSFVEIRAILKQWEKQDGFVPDIIVIDYMDLLITNTKAETRDKQNEIWQDGRALSQDYDCLLLSATQADAAAYSQDRLQMKNFSEDKRKNAHVTAMYGLNQDVKDREKTLGLIRINEIVKREGDYSNANEIIILQDLWKGQPYLGAIW